MLKQILTLCLIISSQILAISATSLVGSWQRTISEDGEKVHEVLLFTDSYFSWTSYKESDSDFIMTKGGSWTGQGDELKLTYEFHTTDPSKVGKTEDIPFKLSADTKSLNLPESSDTPWANHVSTSNDLQGAWLFSGRKNDGEISRRSTDQPRKTMKILTGGWFQWIAYNTETAEFSGTGGGSYTASNGKYVEHIDFFSRDKSRVGAELSFDFDKEDGEWHHSGLNSRGEPMYEIWAPRD